MNPPRIALWFLERSLAPEEREAIVGDFAEEFEARAERDPRAARRWFRSQTRRSLLPNIYRRLQHRRLPRPPVIHSGVRVLNGLATDLRFALRLLRRQPLTSLVAFVSLTAGLGLNVLLLTLADAALLRPLPLREPSSLALLFLQRDAELMHNFSYPDYRELRDGATSIAGLTAYAPVDATVAGTEGTTTVGGEAVSGNFFSTLGVPMRFGRGLTPADDAKGAPPSAIVSESLWRDRLGGAQPIGQVVWLNGQSFVVVGVAGSSFSGMQIGRSASFWVPLAHSAAFTGEDFLDRPGTSWLTLMARLAQGQGRESARSELDATLRNIRQAGGRSVEPLVLAPGGRGDSLLSEQLGSPMVLLLGAGALVLIVACLNVANLHLARTELRRRELAVRSALGARWSQLVRLVVIDSSVIVGASAVCAIWLSALLKDRAAGLIAFYGQPIALDIPLDYRVVAVTLLLSVVAALTIALLTTWQLPRRAVTGGLADGRSNSGSSRPTQRVLVVAQIALSMALLTGASLLVRSLDRLRHADLGYEPRGLALLRLPPEMGHLTPAAAGDYFERAISVVSAMPGVESAAVAHVMPLDFGGSRTSIQVAGHVPARDEDMEMNFVRISPQYFRTLGVPIRDGRGFDERERAGQPDRIIVNETMARRFWPGTTAVGKYVRFSPKDAYDVEVIGVVPDVRYRMVREGPMPTFYVALQQWRATEGVLHVRMSAEPASRLPELRRAVAAVDAAVPITRAHTLVDQIERNVADERMSMAVGVSMAAVALLLATAGLYATMAFLVGRRTREIGVRMALGARGGDVRALVLGQGALLALIGVACGVALSMWVGQVLRSQLYGIGPLDAPSLVASAAILGGAALLATWLPARRAARVDPVITLRGD